MKATCVLALIVGLALPSYGQVQVQICQGQICVPLPPVTPPTTPAPAPPAPMPAPPPTPAPAPAMRPSQGSHTKGLVITAAVSAVGTWALVKLFKRGKGK